MNENKTAIEHVDKWLREKMKGEEVRGLRYEALLDCLQQVEFRAEEEARALESSQTEKDKGCASWDSTYGCMKRLPLAPKPEAKTGNVLTALDKSGLIDKLTDSITYLCPEVDCDTIGDKIEEAVLVCLPSTLEPLALGELAYSKNMDITYCHMAQNRRGLILTSLSGGPVQKTFNEETFAACEQLARTWLNDLKSKE